MLAQLCIRRGTSWAVGKLWFWLKGPFPLAFEFCPTTCFYAMKYSIISISHIRNDALNVSTNTTNTAEGASCQKKDFNICGLQMQSQHLSRLSVKTFQNSVIVNAVSPLVPNHRPVLWWRGLLGGAAPGLHVSLLWQDGLHGDLVAGACGCWAHRDLHRGGKLVLEPLAHTHTYETHAQPYVLLCSYAQRCRFFNLLSK